ncbi:MAG: lipase family protein [Limisphaerales bacterium]
MMPQLQFDAGEGFSARCEKLPAGRPCSPELPIQFDLALARQMAEFSRKAYDDVDAGKAPALAPRLSSSLSPQRGEGLRVRGENYISPPAKQTGVTISPIVDPTSPALLFDPLTNARVLVTDVGDAIVLAFRGTKNIRDWLIDCDFLLKEIGDADPAITPTQRLMGSSPAPRVHRGFLRAMDSLLPKIVHYLEGPDMGGAPKPLLITGHSLGGALATLAAYFLCRRGHPIRAVFTFASPRVGDVAWRREYNGTEESFWRDARAPQTLGEKTFRVAAAGDLVPLVPGLLDGYRHAGTEVFLKAESGKQKAEIKIQPNHAWEILCDEWRAIRAMSRGDLDFILKFHALDNDYLPLLQGMTNV